MRRVRISAKTARLALEAIRQAHQTMPLFGAAIRDLESAMAPPRAAKVRRQRRTAKKATKRDHWDEVKKETRARFWKNAGCCECGCGRGTSTRAEPDHFFGRARRETVDTVWWLSPECHRAKTNNRPDAAWWLVRFIEHCRRYGYAVALLDAQKRLDGMVAVREAEAARHG